VPSLRLVSNLNARSRRIFRDGGILVVDVDDHRRVVVRPLTVFHYLALRVAAAVAARLLRPRAADVMAAFWLDARLGTGFALVETAMMVVAVIAPATRTARARVKRVSANVGILRSAVDYAGFRGKGRQGKHDDERRRPMEWVHGRLVRAK